jgi:hypothetical protein
MADNLTRVNRPQVHGFTRLAATTDPMGGEGSSDNDAARRRIGRIVVRGEGPLLAVALPECGYPPGNHHEWEHPMAGAGDRRSRNRCRSLLRVPTRRAATGIAHGLSPWRVRRASGQGPHPLTADMNAQARTLIAALISGTVRRSLARRQAAEVMPSAFFMRLSGVGRWRHSADPHQPERRSPHREATVAVRSESPTPRLS